MTRKFRFEDLHIWLLAIEVGDQMFDIADSLEARKLFRFAEQLRGAGLSISNNIAEGSGSVSRKEFHQFLNFARRSCFECANIIIVIQRRGYIQENEKSVLFDRLEETSRKTANLQKSLLTES